MSIYHIRFYYANGQYQGHVEPDVYNQKESLQIWLSQGNVRGVIMSDPTYEQLKEATFNIWDNAIFLSMDEFDRLNSMLDEYNMSWFRDKTVCPYLIPHPYHKAHYWFGLRYGVDPETYISFKHPSEQLLTNLFINVKEKQAMINVQVSEDKQEEEVEYPCLMQSTQTGNIVIFSERGEGVLVVQGRDSSPLAGYSDNNGCTIIYSLPY